MQSGVETNKGEFDVLVVGGGIIGLSIARELRKQGAKRITVIERGTIGKEASYAAAGMLAPQAESYRNDAFFQFCFQSNQLFPQFAQELLEETGIDIELNRQGTLYLAFDERTEADIRRRYEWQRRAGLRVELLTASQIADLEPFVSTNVRSGILFPDDGHVENRLLLAALRKFAEIHSISLIENQPVRNILRRGDRVIGIESAAGHVFADAVVLATGAWTSLIEIDGRPLPVRPVRGQMICFAATPGFFKHVIYGSDVYLVPRADGRILVGATVEETGFENIVTTEAVEMLSRAACETAPEIAKLEMIDSWSGLRPCSPDGFPVLGEIDELKNLHLATAHYRNGILLAPLTAKIIAASITHRSSSIYLDHFAARRFSSATVAGTY